MKNIWLLVKVQLGSILDFTLGTKDRKRKKGVNRYLYYLLGIFLFLILSATSFFYSYGIGSTLKLIGMLELLPEFMMAITCVITIFTTIYKVKGTVFGFKDYDVTMSLPVQTGAIVASRLALLYIINIIFTIIVILPANLVYGILSKASPAFYFLSILMVFFVPLVPMVVASVIGTVIAVIASRFRHSNMLNLILSITFLSVFMIISFQTPDSDEVIGEMSAALTKQVDDLYPLARMYRTAICNYSLQSIVLFIGISLLVFLLFSKIVGALFKTINSSIVANRTKANYKIGQLEQASPFKALYRKELKRYFSSSLYVMNTGFGIVMMTIGSIAVLFFSPESLAQILEIPQGAKFLTSMLPIAVTMCVSMSCTTANSISLEGKNLWILKSSPVSPKTIFNSKIAVNLLITIPAIFINGIIITIGIGLKLTDLLILLAMPIAYAFFIAISGLIINLKLPKLEWTTEVTVIKQSAAVLVSMLIGMVIVFIPAILIFTVPINPLIINGIAIVVVALLSMLLYRYLTTKGEQLFSTL